MVLLASASYRAVLKTVLNLSFFLVAKKINLSLLEIFQEIVKDKRLFILYWQEGEKKDEFLFYISKKARLNKTVVDTSAELPR